MKLSNKVLFGGFVSVVGFVIFFIIYMSLSSSEDSSAAYSSDLGETVEYNLLKGIDSDFSNLSLKGAWDVNITHSNEYKAFFIGNENRITKIDVKSIGGKLIIDSSDEIKMDHDSVRLEIALPNLDSLSLEGAGDIELKGFKQQSFNVDIEGLVNIESRKSYFESLTLKLEGAGNIDFKESNVKKLYIKSSMLGNIEVGVDNGIIDGIVEGMGAITLYGSVSDNNLETSGMVELEVR